MTKKDYIKFARMLKNTVPKDETKTLSLGVVVDGKTVYIINELLGKQHAKFTLAVADVLQEDNLNFDKQRFIDAVLK